MALDLGLDHTARARRSHQPPTAGSREPGAAADPPGMVHARIQGALPRLGREEVWQLTRAWLQAVADPLEFDAWSDIAGLRRPDVVPEFLDHGFTPAALKDTLLDGVPVRSRLSNGDDVQEVIAALYRAAAETARGAKPWNEGAE
jgi:hypothetical protein